jgi:hypothetical protein
MKNFKQHKILGSNGPVILLVLFFLIQILETQAQQISNSGTYISITTGTFIGLDSITNYNSATLVNNGTLTINKFNNSAAVENNATLATTTINNSGTFENTGTLTASNSVTNSGTFTNGGDFNTVDLENTETSTFDNTGTLTASNSVTNAGAFTNDNTGTLTAINTVTNSGTFTNGGDFNTVDLENTETSTFDNTGTLNASNSVTNAGTFANDNTGTLTAINTVTNSGTFTNGGDFNTIDLENTETSTFDNTGTLTASNSVTNAGTFTNDGSFTAIETNNTATLENTGTLNVTTMNNEGNTLGDGTYNILGDFTSSGTFFSAAGTVNMIGTTPQIMEMAVTTIDNLVIDNAAAVTLNSTQTIITNSLTVNSGKIFKIEAAKNLTVTGAIANYGGNSGLVLKSNTSGTASLIHNTIDVPVTVQRYISGVAEDWHFLSAPVSNQNIGGDWNPTGTFGNGTGYDLYIFNEPTPCWTYQLNITVAPTWPSIHPASHFVTGRGYLYSTQAPNPTKEFIGLLNNGNVNYPITNESPDLVVKGFNLIGNPYPSSIDWKSVTGWTRTNLVASGGGYDMWIWNQASNNYGVFNSNGDVGTNGVTKDIAPAQGYFIRAASNGNISMSNEIRVHTGASNWLKTKGTDTNSLKIRITSNGGLGYDEVLLQFGYPQNEAGALKLFSQNELAPSAYLNDLNKNLSVRYLTDTIQNSKIPLHFKAGKDGDYSLSLDESATFNVLLLEDKKTKIITDLKINSTYEFKAYINDSTDRFVLHFKPIIEDVISLPVLIYYDGNEINVDLTLVNEQADIKVYDMLGRLLFDKKGEAKMIHRFNIHPKHAVYIVVVNSMGKSISHRILVY